MGSYRALREELGGELDGGEATEAREQQMALALSRFLQEQEVMAAVDTYGRTEGWGALIRSSEGSVSNPTHVLDFVVVTVDGAQIVAGTSRPAYSAELEPNFQLDDWNIPVEDTAVIGIQRVPPGIDLFKGDGGGLRVADAGPADYRFVINRRKSETVRAPLELKPEEMVEKVNPNQLMEGAINSVRHAKSLR